MIEVHDTASELSVARIVMISGDVFLYLLPKKEMAAKSFLCLRRLIDAAGCFVAGDSVKSIRPRGCLLASDDRNAPMLSQ